MDNNKIKIGDTVIPTPDQDYIDFIKTSIDLFLPSNLKDKNITALNVTANNECIVENLNINNSNEMLYTVKRNGFSFPYPPEFLKLVKTKPIKDLATKKDLTTKKMSLDIYEDKIEVIQYKNDGKNEKCTISKFQNESIKSLLDRTFSFVYDLFDKKNVENEKFCLKNGVKYYRFNDFKNLESIEQLTYHTTNIVSTLDKKIGNYAGTKEQLVNKKEEILKNLKEVGV